MENDLSTKVETFRNLERGSWANKREYLLTMIGYAVGLGNAWRFPYIAYDNGGGAFLIPYVMMLCGAGLPLFYLEAALGQFCGQSSFEAFNCIPLLKGIGLTVVVISFYVGIFYTVIIAYAAHYFILSFMNPLPWTTCQYNNSDQRCSEVTFSSNAVQEVENPCVGTNCSQSISASENYWRNVVLQLSSGLHEPGQIRWSLFFELLFTWIIICLCTVKGVKSVGKVVYFTSLFPYVVLTILLIASLRLEGASEGIYFFFKPTWERLGEAKVWQEAATQIFFSLSACLGGLIALSSYNGFHNNCYRDSWIVASVNSFTSIYAAITIFATLGFMAKRLGVDISHVVSSGPGLAFVVYPQAVTELPVPQLWSALFFLMLFTLGLDTMFAITETLVSTIIDGWPHFFHNRRGILTVCTCCFMFVSSILIVTKGGFYWLTLIDSYAAGYAILFAAVIEITAVVYFYGVNNFLEDIAMMLGKKPHFVWKIIWTFITPTILLVILIATLAQFKPLKLGTYTFPVWSSVLGWLIVLSCIGFVPVVAVYEIFYQKRGTLAERFRKTLKPNKHWRPFLDADCTGKYAHLVASLPASTGDAIATEFSKNQKYKDEESTDHVFVSQPLPRISKDNASDTSAAEP